MHNKVLHLIFREATVYHYALYFVTIHLVVVLMTLNNNNLLHLYSAFLGTQSALHRMGGSLQAPPMCSIHLDDATAAILHRTPTTHQLTGGEETE